MGGRAVQNALARGTRFAMKMILTRLILTLPLTGALLPAPPVARGLDQSESSSPSSIHGGSLAIEAFDDGFYALRSTEIPGDVLRSEVGVDTADGTLRSSLYPRHLRAIAPFRDELGSGRLMTVTNTGLAGMPDLLCEFRVYEDHPWGDLRVVLRNLTGRTIEVHSIRAVMGNSGATPHLNGPASEDLILSDRFGEDIPYLRSLNSGAANGGVHEAFGLQLIYNRKSGQSLLLGALSADRLVTIFHLWKSGEYDVEESGTNAALKEQQQGYSPANIVPFRLKVAAGETLRSEPLIFAVGPDYHAQLENYGQAIRILHKALVSTPTPIGWWSWTAYYYGVTANTVLTNAEWLAQNLEPLGYRYFQIDEGYQYARGEYATPDGNAFPHGMAAVAHEIESKGITFGLWVAPFQVSERSWIYENHKDWLVRNPEGEPIHIGKVGGEFDELYALDTTNPGAQEYLKYTYRTLVNDWGVRFIKMDFMDSSAVEGVRYRPNTTALEALRIGLETIRAAVGDGVVLDKDGSPMLTPVGIVNTGRISQDTGHTFQATREAAAGVAARYYMNRNFYGSDPDAFTVSEQIIPDRVWHGNKVPLTLHEAEASIAVSAVSGGMFEIGDDLPALGASPERLALVRNADLLDMARLGRAAVPLDLMTYRPEDGQASLFLLRETRRQQILAVFNWTEKEQSRTLRPEELGLPASGAYTATNVLRGGTAPIENRTLSITLPPHSVRVLKLIDTAVPEAAPAFAVKAPAVGRAGDLIGFRADENNSDAPVLEYHWEFGDGVSADAAEVSHTYTQPGHYTVKVTGKGLNGRTTQTTLVVSVTGMVPAVYNPAAKERYSGPN
jgi:alpha-galactosidase